MFEECFGDGPFIFRLNDGGSGPHLLTQVCLERGWKEFSPENGDHWNLWWRTSGFPVSHHKNLYAWQYINHIPKGSAICRKDNLVRFLRCMRKVYGSIYDFSPHGYNLPAEYTKLAAECSRGRPVFMTREEDSNCLEDKPVWICKPVAQSQGRGIFLFRKLSELTYDTNTIVQRYIEKPLLIGGYKFDLRLYVCIPSYYPLVVYMYREGLARFGTDKFNLTDLRNPFRHLTNSSINKLGPGYSEMKERVGSGCKWTLRQLRRYFQQIGVRDWLLWQKIEVIVVLTVLSHLAQIPPTLNCFEFLGFDILIDENIRPWLLEVNLSPALGNDCDTDRLVKKPLLHDLFDLLGFPLYNTGLSVFNIWNEESKENTLGNSECQKVSSVKSHQRALSVVHAAGKWRQKQKRISSASKDKLSSFRSTSKNSQLTFKGTKPAIAKFTGQSKQELDEQNKKYDEEWKRKHCSSKWGNGRDWKNSPESEGGWMRIWPVISDDNQDGDFQTRRNVKEIVAQITKLEKTAREIAKKHPHASECQLNEFLQHTVGIKNEIWIPPI
ncbi:probable tubulin polyglutamylase TTLL2 [Agrilus planipennis]|uniref:Probable tubulin polyglutamylase TTLL2 n=1 Tax=Agrilus planipennis TaxID=224129 RepID=A0A7F5RIR5_AGRPL|nr:probable tubulin polyglutamylase TTLL2 [Agrilus planipennis]